MFKKKKRILETIERMVRKRVIEIEIFKWKIVLEIKILEWNKIAGKDKEMKEILKRRRIEIVKGMIE